MLPFFGCLGTRRNGFWLAQIQQGPHPVSNMQIASDYCLLDWISIILMASIIVLLGRYTLSILKYAFLNLFVVISALYNQYIIMIRNQMASYSQIECTCQPPPKLGHAQIIAVAHRFIFIILCKPSAHIYNCCRHTFTEMAQIPKSRSTQFNIGSTQFNKVQQSSTYFNIVQHSSNNSQKQVNQVNKYTLYSI